jgi:hypothetical protein
MNGPFTQAMYDVYCKHKVLVNSFNDNRDLCDCMGSVGLESNKKEDIKQEYATFSKNKDNVELLNGYYKSING